MPKLARSRLKHLERLGNVDGPPIGRLLFLLPDLWPEADRRVFEGSRDLDELGALIEGRTGVAPKFGMRPVWAIVVPASEQMLAMSDDDKAAFLDAHETRPLRPDRWNWRGDAADDAREGR